MRRSQRGFTLIELMVALVVSSLLVGMILAIFNRMSIAYRGQQQIAGVQQVLAAARATIELDAKQAGLEMPQGFKIASSPGTIIQPIGVTDNNAGPDQIRFFYADPTTQGAVVGSTGWPATPQLTVDSAAGFLVSDLVVLSTVDVSTPAPINPGVEANVATYDVCVLQITAIGAGTPAVLTFSSSAPWGVASETHCRPNPVIVANPLSNPAQSMIYKFVPRAYKINLATPAFAAQGPLQMSPTGGLIGNLAADGWTDLAYGFTDIQVAVQVANLVAADLDGDGDSSRDWYSGPGMNNLPAVGIPIQMSISLVARTDRNIEGIATAATPTLTTANANNNSLGNRPSVVLPDPIDPALQGSKIYRFTTFQVDFRNLGVGR
jgi:prepilin-type N-terminal cleavage/methylation domain-containing protein